GDFRYRADANERCLGFGFATVVGTVARLHTLTVDAPYRAQGIGTQIMNARLSALAALGVDRVILEISRKNVASMRVATRAGFVPFRESVYYPRSPDAGPAAQQRQTCWSARPSGCRMLPYACVHLSGRSRRPAP